MSVVNLTVTAGGGWSAFGSAFPGNQNDGDAGTYQGWPGNTPGSNDCLFDFASIPDGASISAISVSGLWGAGSAAATVNFSAILGVNSVLLGTVNDVTSYTFSVPKPGGGTWTKTDVQSLRIRVSSLSTGNGNTMRLKSSVLTVTYTLGGAFFIAMLH